MVKQTGPEIYLVVSTDKRASFGDRYFHVTASIRTLKYEESQWIPQSVDDTYEGRYFSGLRISCQGDDQSRSRSDAPVYGFDVTYRDVFAVDRRLCKRMCDLLTAIDKGLEKMTEKRGHVANFGDYCGRVAEVLGCAGIVIDRQNTPAEERTGIRYRTCNIGEGVNAVNNMIWQWVQEAKEVSVA